MKKKIIIVAGPTASGKTSLGIEIAKSIGGEIISADSMQVYKGMPIATAAPTKEETAQVPHHLTEFLPAEESFSVAAWCDMARVKIDEITDRGHIPIVVGGTGLFIDSLADHILFEDIEVNNELRQSLMSKSADALYEELMRVDSDAALQIHKNNKKRVVRALELYYSGVSKTEQNINSKKQESPYDVLYLFLNYEDRQVLYDRINKRVDLMLESGLAEEAKKCISSQRGTAAQAIGHKELIPYLNGNCSLSECADKLKQETRHYAKRQITWFKRRKDAVVIKPDVLGQDEAYKYAIRLCEDFINGKFQKGKSE
ncbi:MAG: tRNA (adenosine(37)-N6)-dimethylallyltransferase MiaA [Clostridium sp.]|nr:tRNA (adenosine(37)-N6)-dimethylallyltransferase MiaA [Clostridium sp.]